jgi:hypothetical protein
VLATESHVLVEPLRTLSSVSSKVEMASWIVAESCRCFGRRRSGPAGGQPDHDALSAEAKS